MHCSSAGDPDGVPVEDLRLARMTEADLDEVLAIERASFASPWQREHFAAEIRRPELALNLVAREATALAAYVCAWCLGGELKINNLAVRADLRSCGVGRWLVTHVLTHAAERGCTLATLEVRPSNAAAIRLYRALGFAEVGRRKGYYAREGEDAILMEARIHGGSRS
jgi:ribosomal-protein-alanine N-acetyltransferase